MERLRESCRRYGSSLLLAASASALALIGAVVSLLRGNLTTAGAYLALAILSGLVALRAWRKRKGAQAPLKFLEQVWER
ncbi:MAG TPA: hypothetical protein ENG69_02240 [Candidatus Korarchaeota archaeon]|nr:hypothetical protein [Candidatus Korarchaeota archaeon]